MFDHLEIAARSKPGLVPLDLDMLGHAPERIRTGKGDRAVVSGALNTVDELLKSGHLKDLPSLAIDTSRTEKPEFMEIPTLTALSGKSDKRGDWKSDWRKLFQDKPGTSTRASESGELSNGYQGHLPPNWRARKQERKNPERTREASNPDADRNLPAEWRNGAWMRRRPAETVQPGSGHPMEGKIFEKVASVYWEGARTATGERFYPDGLTAAHKTLPFGTILTVMYGGREVQVRINDGSLPWLCPGSRSGWC